MAGILVIAEAVDGALAGISGELIGAAKKLSGQGGGTVTAPVAGDAGLAQGLIAAGADNAIAAAQKGYQRLNALAMNTVRPGGLLATCSCSQLVDEETFERTIAAAAADAGRRVTVLHRGSQGPDHPVPPAFPEGRYLKFLLLAVT